MVAPGGGQDRLKSRIFLVYHDLHSNFLEPIRFSTSHSTFARSSSSKTERGVAFLGASIETTARYRVQDLGYWNCEIGINSFESREFIDE